MKTRWDSAGLRVLLAVGILSSVSGCALQVRVREEWTPTKEQPIPLDDVGDTWQDLRAGRIPADDALERYNEAVRSTVVQMAENWTRDSSSATGIRTTEGHRTLRVDPGNIRDFHLVEEVVPAHFVRVKKGFKDHVHVDGVGEPLMVRQRWSEADSMIPSTGLWYPVTGILNLDQPQQPVLELIDPTRRGASGNRGMAFPLSVDYTSTFARDFYDRQRQLLDLPALFKFEKFADRMGMYRVSAFDPEKQACFLVHGVWSSPMSWHLFLNQAYADPEIRERYEFWTFGYPTGAPIPYLAEEFREGVLDVLAFRKANGAHREDVVVVGHSMGGLLAKAATQHGGEADWNKVFRVPLDELDVSDEDREVLRSVVYNDPIPEIQRVVFCSTPHRGSEVAAKPGAKLVGDLIQVPRQLAEATREIVKQSQGVLTPLGLELAKMPTSVDQLRPSSSVTAEFLNKPLNPNVKFHSVIGRKNPRTPVERSSDGVVPYTSSHIEGVVSEAIVDNSPHGVHREEAGIAEILRILKLP